MDARGVHELAIQARVCDLTLNSAEFLALGVGVLQVFYAIACFIADGFCALILAQVALLLALKAVLARVQHYCFLEFAVALVADSFGHFL